MLDWHSCQICYPLEKRILLLLLLLFIIFLIHSCKIPVDVYIKTDYLRIKIYVIKLFGGA